MGVFRNIWERFDTWFRYGDNGKTVVFLAMIASFVIAFIYILKFYGIL